MCIFGTTSDPVRLRGSKMLNGLCSDCIWDGTACYSACSRSRSSLYQSKFSLAPNCSPSLTIAFTGHSRGRGSLQSRHLHHEAVSASDVPPDLPWTAIQHCPVGRWRLHVSLQHYRGSSEHLPMRASRGALEPKVDTAMCQP